MSSERTLDGTPRLLLVIAEAGVMTTPAAATADWRGETLLVTQPAGELPVTLALRVAEAVTALERSSQSIGRALVLVGTADGLQVSRARHLICRLIFAHMVAREAGELVLSAETSNEALRDELVDLTETLLLEHDGNQVPIRLRFGDAGVARASEIRSLVNVAEKPARTGWRG